jgi:hypothetical protein
MYSINALSNNKTEILLLNTLTCLLYVLIVLLLPVWYSLCRATTRSFFRCFVVIAVKLSNGKIGIHSRASCICCSDNNVIVERQQPAKRTEQLKAFIRNIGVPAPAVVGKKLAPGSQTAGIPVASASNVVPATSGSSASGASSAAGGSLISSPIHRQSTSESGTTSTGATSQSAATPKVAVFALMIFA